MNVNEHKIKSIFEKYCRRLVVFCNGIIHNTEESEDIVIDVFVELWKRVDSFESEDHMNHFLFLAAKRRCINYMVRQKRHQTCELTNDIIDYAEINAIVVENIYNAINSEVEKLPNKQRGIIRGYLSGLDAHQISAKLGMSYKTVCNVKGIAINKLKSSLNLYINEFI